MDSPHDPPLDYDPPPMPAEAALRADLETGKVDTHAGRTIISTEDLAMMACRIEEMENRLRTSSV